MRTLPFDVSGGDHCVGVFVGGGDRYDTAQHFQVLLTFCCDAHHQLHLVPVPVDPLRIGHDHHTGALDKGLDVVGAVGNGHMTADGHGKALLPVQHPLDICLVHIAAPDHQLAALADGLLRRDAGAAKEDVFLFQQDGSSIGGGRGCLLCGFRSRRGTALLRLEQFRHHRIIFRRAHEVLDGDDPGLGRPLGGAAGQFVVSNYDLTVSGDLGDGVVDDLNAGDARIHELIAQHGGAHGGGTHARVTGKDDLPHLSGPDRRAGGDGDGLALACCFAGGYLLPGGLQVALLAECFQQHHRQCKTDCRRHGDPQDIGKVRVLRGHQHLGNDAAGGRRALQSAAQQGQHQNPRRVARHGRQDQDGIHQHVGEVQLMDAADELDESGSGGGGAGRALTGHTVGQQQSQSGTGVGFDHEQDGLARLHGLLGPDGVKTPWLMALLRNSTLAGSTSTAVMGSRLWLTSHSTPFPNQPVRVVHTGPMRNIQTMDRMPPMMPTEKLLTNISKPAGIRGWANPSNLLIHQPPGDRRSSRR